MGGTLRLWGGSPAFSSFLGAPGDPGWWLSGSSLCSHSLSFSSSLSHEDISPWIWVDTLIQGNLLSISLVTPSRTLCLSECHRGNAPEAGCWFGLAGSSEFFPASVMKWFSLISEFFHLICLMASLSLWLSDFDGLCNLSGPRAGLPFP